MDLKECREKLDVIDEKIVRLFEERMEISEQVAAYKAEHGLPVLDAVREQQKLAAVTELVSDPKNRESAAALFEKIMELSRQRQESII
ncbi:MAG: chorismate mutase [Lachnospiraceae bacterium]|nr:chorismate mutase [Lachnospiraceae bacterium]